MKLRSVPGFLAACAIAIATLASLGSCASLPSRLLVEPSAYEDDEVIIRYGLGEAGYLISIFNKTPFDMALDLERSSVISWSGESRNLQLRAADNHIPPRSLVVFRSEQELVFSTDIAADPLTVAEPAKGARAERGSATLRDAIGTELRLYLPILVRSGGRAYDLRLKVVGVRTGKREYR